MKKIVTVIFIFFLMLTNVYAKFDVEKIIDEIHYEKNDGKNTYYRYAAKIVDVKTNEIVYCIEPFVDLILSDNYVGYTDYNKIFNLEEKDWEKLKLYSYYGYGYKNHTTDKWISITQLSLWRAVFPEYRFDWIDNFKNKRIIKPYDKEINELKKLVDTHYLVPSFNEKYLMGIKSTLILKDNNNVLENFEVVSSDFKYEIDGNSIKIYSDIEKTGKIELVKAKNKYKNQTIFYYDKNSQAVVKKGNIGEIKFSFEIEVREGKILVNKVDDDTLENTPQGDASLDGAIYEIFDANMTKVKEEKVENNYIKFSNLSFGKYFIKELSAGEGYYVDPNIYEVNLDENISETEIKLSNKVVKSKVNIYKYYGNKNDYDNNKMKPEKDIFFEIYDSKNNFVIKEKTNGLGIINVELPFGKYVIKQINTTNGYHKVNDYNLVIDENNNKSQDIVLFDMKIEVPNAGIYN